MTILTFAEAWDGTSWTIQSTPYGYDRHAGETGTPPPVVGVDSPPPVTGPEVVPPVTGEEIPPPPSGEG